MNVTDMTVTIINCYRNKGLAVRDATLLIPFSTLIRMVMLPEAHSDVFDGRTERKAVTYRVEGTPCRLQEMNFVTRL